VSGPSLIDTHAHLCDARFDADRPEVLERARASGVVAIIAVGESLADARTNIDLSERFAVLKPVAGLYPTRLDLAEAEEMEQFVRENRGRLFGIGEVGLDRWAVRDGGDLETQRTIFRRFVALAMELDLPLNVHSRSAGRRTVETLLESGARRVHMHAFDGRHAAAMPAIEAGWKFSVPPSIVRSRQKQKLFTRIPLSSLMLESDSPVLGPDPQERNEPANVTVALAAIADLHGVSQSVVAETTSANARELYRIDD
jgi:TatD DNase family protein